MTKHKGFIKELFWKAITKTNTKPKVDSNYEIKYDDSAEELVLLGLATKSGVVIDRDGYNQYSAVIESRNRIRELPDFERLKKEGIVNEKGDVLDEKRLQVYKQQQSIIEMQMHEKSY